MLSSEFMLGCFATAFILGFSIGFHILGFKKAAEVSTSS
ncbi:putative membrane protein [Vibrio parahaemolyticus SBR10290]|jgi:hypothetical protein|nr:putative membrane protein [Vibrio parahaemolyticus 10290]ETX60432.1 putative membrane protein [Vibrio parahaemolyticus SBR10290]KIS72783.1 hypothetical protein H321_24200 [Vibrio parahaemolyticus 97-10290]